MDRVQVAWQNWIVR